MYADRAYNVVCGLAAFSSCYTIFAVAITGPVIYLSHDKPLVFLQHPVLRTLSTVTHPHKHEKLLSPPHLPPHSPRSTPIAHSIRKFLHLQHPHRLHQHPRPRPHPQCPPTLPPHRLHNITHPLHHHRPQYPPPSSRIRAVLP